MLFEHNLLQTALIRYIFPTPALPSMKRSNGSSFVTTVIILSKVCHCFSLKYWYVVLAHAESSCKCGAHYCNS